MPDDPDIAEAQMLAREYLLAEDAILTVAAQDLKLRIARAVLSAAAERDQTLNFWGER